MRLEACFTNLFAHSVLPHFVPADRHAVNGALNLTSMINKVGDHVVCYKSQEECKVHAQEQCSPNVTVFLSLNARECFHVCVYIVDMCAYIPSKVFWGIRSSYRITIDKETRSLPYIFLPCPKYSNVESSFPGHNINMYNE
jgi:hypothetical protein